MEADKMFKRDKATAAAAHLIERAGGTMNDLRLMKLLYMAERESLREFTATITGSKFSSMKNGPVLSDFLRMMKGEVDHPLWREHLSFHHYTEPGMTENTVVLRRRLDPEQHLSRAEVSVLDSIWEDYGDHSKWDLVDLTHEFPEWDGRAKDLDTSFNLSIRDIYHLGLKEPEELARAKAADVEYYEELLG